MINIFESYADAGQQLPQRDKERFYTALIEFIGYGKEPELDGPAAAVFTAIRPTLEKSKKRAEAGRAGGNATAKNNICSDFATEQNESKAETSQEANGQPIKNTYTSTSTCNSKGVGGTGEGEADPKVAEAAEEIVAYLNAKLGTSYKPKSKGTLKHISARMRDGFTVADFKTVIDKKAAAWMGTDMAPYLRPETLFGGKFEGYLNEIQAKPKPKTYEEVGNELFSEYNRS